MSAQDARGPMGRSRRTQVAARIDVHRTDPQSTSPRRAASPRPGDVRARLRRSTPPAGRGCAVPPRPAAAPPAPAPAPASLDAGVARSSMKRAGRRGLLRRDRRATRSPHSFIAGTPGRTPTRRYFYISTRSGQARRARRPSRRASPSKRIRRSWGQAGVALHPSAAFPRAPFGAEGRAST